MRDLLDQAKPGGKTAPTLMMGAASFCSFHPICEQHHLKSCISERMKRRKGKHQCRFPHVDGVWPAASSSFHHDFPTDIKSCIPRTVSQSDLLFLKLHFPRGEKSSYYQCKQITTSSGSVFDSLKWGCWLPDGLVVRTKSASGKCVWCIVKCFIIAGSVRTHSCSHSCCGCPGTFTGIFPGFRAVCLFSTLESILPSHSVGFSGVVADLQV